jgi:hypothetical protein
MDCTNCVGRRNSRTHGPIGSLKRATVRNGAKRGMIVHVFDSIVIVEIYRWKVTMVTVLVGYITRVWGRHTGTGVSRGECMAVNVWRRWDS